MNSANIHQDRVQDPCILFHTDFIWRWLQEDLHIVHVSFMESEQKGLGAIIKVHQVL